MKIYLVSARDLHSKILLKARSRFNLISFYYARNLRFSIENLISKSESIMVDSGAFTILDCGCQEKIDSFVNELDNFCEKYISFLVKYKFDLFFELDLYDIIGIQKTEQLRIKIEQKTQKKTIPVFHRCLGIDYFYKLVEKYKYIAIGGIDLDIKESDFLWMYQLVRYANNKGVNVHGLGMTRLKYLYSINADDNFYSVDSGSWILDRYGDFLYLGKSDARISFLSGKKIFGSNGYRLRNQDAEKALFISAYSFVKLQNQLYYGG